MTAAGSIIAIAVFAGVLASMPATIERLRRQGQIDRPDPRRLHETPTPRGGGLPMIVGIGLGGIALNLVHGDGAAWAPVWAGAALLAAVSFADDRRGVTPAVRLLAQFVAVGIAIGLGPIDPARILPDLPPFVSTAVTVLSLVWFVNLYNFMDGADGIVGVETVGISVGLLSVLWLAPAALGSTSAAMALVVLAAILAFLRFNWHPARVFMGDIGSVPLGFIVGWLLLDLAANGYVAAALLLPGYFIADATITLAARLARGERIWLAHRQHFYQRAVSGGLSHAQVAGRVALADAVLVGAAAMTAIGYIWQGAALGIAAIAVLLAVLQRHAGARQP